LWTPFPGGAERFVFNISDQMRQRGHSVVVETSYWKARDSDGIKIAFHDIGVRSQSETRHADGWSIIAADIRATQPDVILTHHFFAYEFEPELAELRIPIIQVVHNGARMACARLAIFNSEWTRSHASAQSHDMTIIPPAFEDVDAVAGSWTSALPPLPAPMRKCIGFIKPIEHKGVDFIYRLAEAMPDRKFLILRGEWILIEKIRPLPNVEFMESVLEIRDFYRRCRIMLAPSVHEDAGTIPQEAAVNGLPCISSNVMGLTETNAAGIRLDVGVAEVWNWIEEIRKLDDPAHYAAVAERQLAGLDRFRWLEKFDALSAWIERTKR
jgi:glycosyltransferase involved in cell wall biosynthesis